jgi:hypothetical protein
MVILLIFAGSVALVAFVTLKVFRLLTGALGLKEVLQEGFVMTDNGLEILGMFLIGKRKIPYADIKSVEFVPYKMEIVGQLRFRYG